MRDGWSCVTEISIIVSMFLSLTRCAFDIFLTGKRVSHGGEYGLKILANYHFYLPGDVINLARKLNYNDLRKLKQNCKILLRGKRIHIFIKEMPYVASFWRIRYR